MKKLLKIISAVLAAATLSALCPAAFAADSPEAHQAEAIDSLIRQEIVLGDEYGNVMESDPITREQMVSVIGRILDFDDSRFSGLEEYFTDAGQISDWAYSYVLEGFENGIVDGYPDKTFRPQNLMLYEEAVKFTLCAFLRLSDTDPAEYLKAYYTYPDGFIELARENNYLYGTNGTLGEPMSRGDVFTLIYRGRTIRGTKDCFGIQQSQRRGRDWTLRRIRAYYQDKRVFNHKRYLYRSLLYEGGQRLFGREYNKYIRAYRRRF